jgi:HEAT repeat protein
MLSRTFVAALMGLGLASVFALAVAAQISDQDRPRIENARLEERPLTRQLIAEVKSWADQAVQAQWLGYSVPQVAGDRHVCCGNYDGNWNDGCGNCRLEDRGKGSSVNMSSGEGTAKLEGPRAIAILFRAENKQVMKIRVVSEECVLDAGGLRFVWLSGVKPAESVELLESFVRGADLDARDADRIEHGALTAMAMHADATADRALESFTSSQQPSSLRRQAAFWLGSARAAAGLSTLKKMAKNDPSADVRAHVTFALSVSREAGALEEMIRMAHDDESAHVRGQALFWLAHKAGEKAVGAITGAVENDPDTEVKKKAVFALSQLPKDEGVPKLIEVAQNNRNREVRKQAMFWLGQSHDPRALDFFEKILMP